MNKVIRLIRRVFALSLVLLLSIESFAAVVTDNDGSAFITKAEFDSLKNNFQAQIDNYNTSIDNKIDGAIAAYLAGIKVASEGNEDVLYFKTFPKNETAVYMRSSTENTSTYGRSTRNCNWGFSSMYTSNFAITANAYNTSSSYSSSSRRFVNYNKSEGTYRWAGYTTNYYEKLTITGFCNAGSADTGYSNDNVYLYAPYTASYSRTGYRTNATTGWQFSIADAVNRSPYRSCSAISVAWEANNYELKYTKDLIYEDFSANQNWYNTNAQWFAVGNPSNYWWAGSSHTYSYNDYSVSGSARIQYGGSGITNRTVQNTLQTRTGSSGSYYYISTCPEPNIKRWYQILANDTSKYYDAKTKDYIQDYNVCEGMPVVEAEKNKLYTWPIKFNNSTRITLKYGKYGTTETTPTTPIKISVSTDGGKTWSAYANSATLKEGIIKFESDKIGGVVFCKWNNSRCMYKDGSSTIKWKELQY